MVVDILTDDDRSNMRLALEERIISLLRLYGAWEQEIKDTFYSYQKVGGYFMEKDFRELTGVKL